MRKIKEVLRLKWDKDPSNRQIAKAGGISRSTVSDYLRRAIQASLGWNTHAIYLTADRALRWTTGGSGFRSTGERPFPAAHRPLSGYCGDGCRAV